MISAWNLQLSQNCQEEMNIDENANAGLIIKLMIEIVDIRQQLRHNRQYYSVAPTA